MCLRHLACVWHNKYNSNLPASWKSSSSKLSHQEEYCHQSRSLAASFGPCRPFFPSPLPLLSYRCSFSWIPPHPRQLVARRKGEKLSGKVTSSPKKEEIKIEIREIRVNCAPCTGHIRQGRGAAQKLWFWNFHPGKQNWETTPQSGDQDIRR